MNGLNKSLCGQRLVHIKPHNRKEMEKWENSARVFLKKLIFNVDGHKSLLLDVFFNLLIRLFSLFGHGLFSPICSLTANYPIFIPQTPI